MYHVPTPSICSGSCPKHKSEKYIFRFPFSYLKSTLADRYTRAKFLDNLLRVIDEKANEKMGEVMQECEAICSSNSRGNCQPTAYCECDALVIGHFTFHVSDKELQRALYWYSEVEPIAKARGLTPGMVKAVNAAIEETWNEEEREFEEATDRVRERRQGRQGFSRISMEGDITHEIYRGVPGAPGAGEGSHAELIITAWCTGRGLCVESEH